MVNWAAILISATALTLGAASYEDEVRQWRAEREARLTSDTGWLTITGLFWLRDGDNPVGAAESNRVILPAHSAPPRFGVIERAGERIVLRYADRSKGSVELKPDSRGEPTTIRMGDIAFWVIERGGRFGVRVRDQRSEFRRKFTGCRWYPVSPDYRIAARFVPDPKIVRVPTVIGIAEKGESPGYVEFELHGKSVRLRPTASGDELFFAFRDETSGKTTYGASRFLYSGLPIDGKVILDFNKAYNPPCAFTPYATCPLATAENRIPAPVEAGELAYEQH